MSALQYTPYTSLLILTAAIALVLTLIALRQGRSTGSQSTAILMASLFIWTVAYTCELAFVDFEIKRLGSDAKYIGICILPIAWLAFTLEYTGNTKWLTRRNFILLSLLPALMLIVAWTNPLHHLFWTSRTLQTWGGVILLAAPSGPAFWVLAFYIYGLLLFGNVLLIRAFLHTQGIFRKQIATIMISAFFPWIANALYIFDISPFPHLDLTPLAFLVTGAVVSWSLFRFRLLDVAPIARDTVFDYMTDAALVIDMASHIVDINQAALKFIGLSSASEALGKLPSQVLAAYPDLIANYRGVNEAHSEIEISRGGQSRTFQLQITPLFNRRKQQIGRLYLLHEITELKRASEQIKMQNDVLTRTNQELMVAREQAVEASRLKSEFLATMSHELRTPLNSIIGYTDFLLSSAANLTEKQQDYLKRVLSNGERLLSLINDILDISKIEAARVELASDPFSVVSLLEGIQNRMQTLADQKGLHLETFLDPTLPQLLKGDVRRLEQILVNLLSNAIRFTKEGKIAARFERVGAAQWKIVVQDSGIGIPAQALSYIFEAFRQVDGSTRREYGGTGLGLAIVEKLVQLMNGHIDVESEVGKGSTFTILLPLITDEVVKEHIGA